MDSQSIPLRLEPQAPLRPEPEPASPTTLTVWQDTLLPRVVIALVVLGVVFFVGAFVNYATLTAQLNVDDTALETTIEKLTVQHVPQDFQESYARIALEDRVLRHRYRMNTAAIESRAWTRLMGFVTGMVMVLTGCLFIVARLQDAFEASGKAPAGEGALRTNSPGLVLAVVGAGLIATSLVVKTEVRDTDAAVYLPRLVEYSVPGVPVAPAASSASGASAAP